MKRIILTALFAAVLAPSIASAHSIGVPHLHDVPIVAPDLDKFLKGPVFKTRPEWSYQVEREVLKPRLPYPGPVCLSCPPFEMERPGTLVIQR